ncbi:MAG: rhodanese-like domain-containing protein [Coraliomargarita sp.]|nr:rhodanese-like domain-containing protein [Coraliomargarita sp.]
MSLIREFLLIATIVVVGSAYSLFSGLAPAPWAEQTLAAGEIRYGDAAVLDVIWVDARSETAFAEAHLPEALWFDIENWDNSLIEIVERWLTAPRPIVVYCSSESCSTSRDVAEKLRADLPDAEIYSLKGGWTP